MSDIIIRSSLLDPAAEPLIDGLASEYNARYGAASRPGGARAEIMRYPSALFSPPLGDFLLLRRDGQTIAGGAFMSHDDETAEFKPIWTHPDLRPPGRSRDLCGLTIVAPPMTSVHPGEYRDLPPGSQS